MCTVLLPPAVNPIAVKKSIPYHICWAKNVTSTPNPKINPSFLVCSEVSGKFITSEANQKKKKRLPLKYFVIAVGSGWPEILPSQKDIR